MDSERRDSLGCKENADKHRRNSKDNTEYVPTRCRITKPIPPKPAANPMQFVKIGPCELFRKAQEQLKKVEEVKTVRPEIRDEAEDWQANLDNWKSSRRKRQEHIIERVVEVKKFEQQGVETERRKSKTFNEILEERNKRKNKPNITIFNDDDSNDLSDYGIGSSPNYNENVTSRDSQDLSHEDNNTIEIIKQQNCDLTKNETDLNEKQMEMQQIYKTESKMKNSTEKKNDELLDTNKIDDNNKLDNRYDIKKKSWQDNYKQEMEILQPEVEQYTYESAIQGYRSRVISKTNINPSSSLSTYVTDNKSEKAETNTENNPIMPKGSILKRKEIFENDKMYELNHLESTTSRRLSDDFVHSQSLKQRLLSLEKCTEQPLRNTDSNKYYTESPSAPSRPTYNDNTDIKNNNNNNNNKMSADQFVRSRVSLINNLSDTTVYDNQEKANKPKSAVCTNWSNKSVCYSSPESGVFVNKLNNIHRSLDNLTDVTHSENMQLDRVQSLEGLEYCHSNYPASNSSTELLVLSSQYGDTDREDSGIHTADVSCSVSQADEPVEDADISNTVSAEKTCFAQDNIQSSICVNSQSEEESSVDGNMPIISPLCTDNSDYINSNIYNLGFDGVFVSEEFPLGPPVTALEPPKEKPPPPPITDSDVDFPDECELTRLNSTKRIKKEMRMKRSSFLGIEPDDQIEIESSIRKPPDINSFLQKESRLEKQLYKKNQSSYSEAGDSQDSGVELERGRLSSDTWCSSLPDSASGLNVLGHSRQSSEPCTTNSITSEEDEITKKEREIIELVEKEEKWRDKNEFPECNTFNKIDQTSHIQNIEINKNSIAHLQRATPSNYVAIEDDDDHSEVLRVEHELLQLEREELKRQRENMVFRESRSCLQSNTCLKNKRLSLDDISGSNNTQSPYVYQADNMDYRKSMPELQRDVPVQNFNLRAQSSGLISSGLPYVTPVKYPKASVRETYERESNTDFINNDESYERGSPGGKVIHPISRHSLQLLSAAPRSRLVPQDNWIQPKAILPASRDTFNYNQHWLIQEAEQRRLTEQKYVSPSIQNWKYTRSEKHLPDSVIQTLTQRVQNKVNISERNAVGRRMDNTSGHYSTHSSHSVGHALPIHHPHLMIEESQDKMLSVSGKKKCSYCGNELGRGAAMIIESLCLFYHMDCFKCCVCHVQLGDGLMGTDVRVRNNKLHCHNCYSSDDGVKFSCV